MKKLDFKMLAIVIAMVALYGSFDAVKDTLAHHYSTSIFSNWNVSFWDANSSWCNKWENCVPGQERFLGSSSVFSFLTDGWHLMKFFQNRLWLLLPALVLTVGNNFENRFLDNGIIRFLIFYIGLAWVQDGVFTLLYNWLLLK